MIDWAKFSEYGLLGLTVCAVITLLFLIVKWVLDHVKELLKQQAEERKCWQETVKKVSDALDNHTIQAREFHDSQKEANKYNREEHRQIIEICGRINGYTARG